MSCVFCSVVCDLCSVFCDLWNVFGVLCCVKHFVWCGLRNILCSVFWTILHIFRFWTICHAQILIFLQIYPIVCVVSTIFKLRLFSNVFQLNSNPQPIPTPRLIFWSETKRNIFYELIHIHKIVTFFTRPRASAKTLIFKQNRISD